MNRYGEWTEKEKEAMYAAFCCRIDDIQIISAQIDDISNDIICLDIDIEKEAYLLRFRDDGQSCCERRHMHSDDDLSYFVGADFLYATIKRGPSEEYGDEGDVRECQFLEIGTSKGAFIIANYNDHNGYYGGFDLTVDVVKKWRMRCLG